MTRYVSLIALLAVIAVMGILSYRVMSGFLLPLFLAALLAALFHPIHRRLSNACGGRSTLAAGLTTGFILMIVLLPIAGVVGLALFDAQQTLANLAKDKDQIDQKLGDLRDNTGLSIPFAPTVRRIQAEFQRIHDGENGELAALPLPTLGEAFCPHVEELGRRMKQELERVERLLLTTPAHETRRWFSWMTPSSEINFFVDPLLNDDDHPEITWEKSEANRVVQLLRNPTILAQFNENLHELQSLCSAMRDAMVRQDGNDYRIAIVAAEARFQTIQSILLGSSLRGPIVQLVNPSKSQIETWVLQGRDQLQEWLPSITGQATSMMMQLLVGAGIMTVAMFYFLADGSAMIRATMRLSPLDDRYEEELLREFDSVSRAVVMATLLSALAQGILAAIGYFVVGVDKTILLTLLTTVLALVPFVGASVVWVPVCLWLIFVEQRTFAGVGLALYCAGVVSTVDNFVKPYILHGQSRLHPLLALLSVLGGVQTLGPVGLIVGPMVVSFLQALLNMLRSEISEISEFEAAATTDAQLPPVQVASVDSATNALHSETTANPLAPEPTSDSPSIIDPASSD